MRIIIIGAGEVGYHIAQRLASENKEVVVVDKSAEALARVGDQLDVKPVQGSGSSPRVLEEAGIKGAELLLAVTDSDEINLIACFFANVLAPSIRKVARIRNEEYTTYEDALARDILNISTVINPDEEVVKTIRRLMSVPGALEISEFAGGRIKMIGMLLPHESPLAGVKLKDLRRKIGDIRVLIGALVRNDRLIIPSGDDEMKGEDVVYFISDDASLGSMVSFFGAKPRPVHNVLIIGGGNLGFKLARELDSKKFHTKIIDKNQARSVFLSSELERGVVLMGDGTDQDLLEEENAGTMDMVVSLTGDEETNILTCLLAKRMGAKKTVARINKFAYMPLVQALGIDHIASPRLSAINSILHHIRRGKVLSTVSIKGDDAEVMEAIALEHSEIVGKPIMDLDFPRGAIILCVVRQDEVVIPGGTFVIEPQDRIIILSTRPNVSKVERALTVKLDYF